LQSLKKANSLGLLIYPKPNLPLPENETTADTRRKVLDQISVESLPPNRQTYSVKEIAAMLGVSTKSIYRIINRGLLRSLKGFRHHRIPRKELERFLQQNL